MQTHPQKSIFLQTHNQIQLGLNFIVPQHWWNQFCNINYNTIHLTQLQYPQHGHIDTLRDFDILTYNWKEVQAQVVNVKELCQDGKKIIRESFRSIRQKQQEEIMATKVNNQIHDYCTFGIPFKNTTFATILICPQINRTFSQQMNIEWYVVNPTIYLHIMKHQSQQLNLKQYLIGLPIFINEKGSCQMKYKLKSQLLSRLAFVRQKRQNVAVIGYIDRQVQISQLLTSLSEHLQLQTSAQPTKHITSTRNWFILNQLSLYHYLEQQGLRCLYQHVCSYFYYVQHVKIYQFGNRDFVVFDTLHSIQQVEGNVVDEVFKDPLDIIVRNAKGTKKVKLDGYIGDSDNRLIGFHKYGRSPSSPIIIPQDRPIIDLHQICPSSTQGETPQQHILSNETNRRAQHLSNQFRIQYTIWQSGPNPNNFRKLSQSKMNNFITIPLSTQPHQHVFVRDNKNKRVYFQISGNRLQFNQYTQMLEEQEVTPEVINQYNYPAAASISLQWLSRRIMARYLSIGSTVKEFQKNQESEIDQQSYLDVQTCKYDYGLDQEESRQIQ